MIKNQIYNYLNSIDDMKTGVILEYGDNVKNVLPYDYICETLSKFFNYLDDDTDVLEELWYDKSVEEEIDIDEVKKLYKTPPTPYKKLTFSQKRKLSEYGYDEEYFNSLKPMYDQTYKWSMITGFPYDKYVLSTDELKKWKQLINICNIINS